MHAPSFCCFYMLLNVQEPDFSARTRPRSKYPFLDTAFLHEKNEINQTNTRFTPGQGTPDMTIQVLLDLEGVKKMKPVESICS